MGTVDVWGVVGTWVVGVAAAAIALLQLRESQFRPRAIAKLGRTGENGPPDRLVVEIRNRGGAPGMIRAMGLYPAPEHEKGKKAGPQISYPGWPDDHKPVPFVLGGRSTAIVVIHLDEPFQPLYRLLIRYDAQRSACVKIATVNETFSIVRTELPPDSLAIVQAPRNSECRCPDPDHIPGPVAE